MAEFFIDGLLSEIEERGYSLHIYFGPGRDWEVKLARPLPNPPIDGYRNAVGFGQAKNLEMALDMAMNAVEHDYEVIAGHYQTATVENNVDLKAILKSLKPPSNYGVRRI